MGLGDIPLWGQWGLLGLSLGMNIFIAVEFIRGTWTTRKNLDQVQKVADTFKDAWEASDKKWETVGPILNNIVGVQESILHHLEDNTRPRGRGYGQ